MKKSTVYISYIKWGDDSLVTLAGHTVTALTDNPYFPEPRPTMDVYSQLVLDYREKQEIARNGGGRLQKEARDNARLLLTNAMRELAFYVNNMAQGNREILVSSGFVLIPEDKPSTIPSIPLGLRVSDGRQSGEIYFLFDRVKGAIEYEYQLATELDGQNELVWGRVLKTSRSRPNYVSGFEPASRCYVRVRARNAQGESGWTEPVPFIVR